MSYSVQHLDDGLATVGDGQRAAVAAVADAVPWRAWSAADLAPLPRCRSLPSPRPPGSRVQQDQDGRVLVADQRSERVVPHRAGVDSAFFTQLTQQRVQHTSYRLIICLITK